MPAKTGVAIAKLKSTRAVFQTQPQKHAACSRHAGHQPLTAAPAVSDRSHGVLTTVPASQVPWQSSKREQQSPREDGAPDHAPTQLIFNLYNRGSGWGEEIIPHLTVQKRAVLKKPRQEWQEGSIEALIAAEGVDEEVVDDLVASLVAWRVTKSGRPLVDKRRRRRVLSNVPLVVDFLVEKCGIPRSREGVGALIQRFPMVLLCKPFGANDRFWRNAASLAAFAHQHGHCNVPEGERQWRTLARFVARLRILKAEGRLEQEKVDVLTNFQFDFGSEEEVPQAEWEAHFDTLLEWLLCSAAAPPGRPGDAPLDPARWQLMDWGARGTPDQRRLAAWVAQQRHLRRQGALSAAATARLEAINFEFEDTDDAADDREWLQELGGLMHVAVRAEAASSAPSQRLKTSPPSRSSAASSAAVSDADEDAGAGEEEAAGDGGRAAGTALGPRQLQQLDGVPLPRRQWLWLQRQRALWRQGRLPEARTRLLYAAGVDTDPYTSAQWRRLAHATSAVTSFEPVPYLTAAGAGAADNDADFARTRVSAVRRWVLTQRRLVEERRLTQSHAEYLAAAGVGWLVAPGGTSAPEDDWRALFAGVAGALGATRTAVVAEEVAEVAPPAPVVTVVDDGDEGDDLGGTSEQQSGASGVGAAALLGALSSAVRMHAMQEEMSVTHVLGAAAHTQHDAAVDTMPGYGQIAAAWGGRAGTPGAAAAADGARPVPASNKRQDVGGTDSGTEAGSVRSSGDAAAAPDAVRLQAWGEGSGCGDSLNHSSRAGSGAGVSPASGWSWSGPAEARRSGRRGGRRGRDARWITGLAGGGRGAADTDSGVDDGGIADRYDTDQYGEDVLGHGADFGALAAATRRDPALPRDLFDSAELLLGPRGGKDTREQASVHGDGGTVEGEVCMDSGNVVADTFGAVAKAARATRSRSQVLVAACATAAASSVAVLDVAHGARGSAARMHAWASRRCAEDAAFRRAVLADWLQRQYALRVLGMLPPERSTALQHLVRSAGAGAHGGGATAAGESCAVERREYKRLWCELSRSPAGLPPVLTGGVWGRRVAELIRYRRRNGSADVPILGAEEELAMWIESVKALRTELPPAQVAQAWALGLTLHLPGAGASGESRR